MEGYWSHVMGELFVLILKKHRAGKQKITQLR